MEKILKVIMIALVIMLTVVGCDFQTKSVEVAKSMGVTIVNGVPLAYEINNGQASILRAMSCTGDLTIPSKICGCQVTSIGECAFSEQSGLTTVKIPQGVKNIGREAFRGCGRLKSVTIPLSVVQIDIWAFKDCDSLGEGVISVDGCVLAVNGECPKDVVLKEGTRLIAGGAFMGCERLVSVILPEGVTSIGEGAFFEYGRIKQENVVLPNGTRLISGGAFSGCEAMKSITIPSSVKSQHNVHLMIVDEKRRII